MTTLEVPTLVKTEDIATGPNGKRARDELPAATPLATKLGKLKFQGSRLGTKDRPRYVQLEFDRTMEQRALATVRFPDAMLTRFRIGEKDVPTKLGTTFKMRDFIAPQTRDEIGTRTEYGDFAQGEAERLVAACVVDGRTPVDLVLARFPMLAGAVPEWDPTSTTLSRFMRATRTSMSVWSKGTYGKGEAAMKEQDPFDQAHPVSTSETPGEDGVFLVHVFEGGKFAQRKGMLRYLEAVVTEVQYSDLDGGKDGVKSASAWLTPMITAVHFELM